MIQKNIKHSHNRQLKDKKESFFSRFSFPLSSLLVIILGIILYYNTLNSPFYFDDYDSIVGDPLIKNLQNFAQFPNFIDAIHSRFVSSFTLALNFHFGVFDVIGYHLVNIFIHLINSLLVMLFVSLTFKTPKMINKYPPKEEAIYILISGLIFVTHPIQTQAVTYIIQRMTALATMFFIASIIFYIKARFIMKRQNPQKAKYIKTILYFSLALFAFILGLWSKQIVATLPIVIIVYEFLFLRKEESINWKKAAIIIIPLIIVIAIGIIFIGLPSETAEITRKDYFLTEINVIVTYLKLAILPINLNLDYDYRIINSLFNFSTIFSLVIILLLLFYSARVYKKYPILSFSILWFFLTLSVESSIIPIHDVIVEHRVYLPLLGFSLFIVSILMLFPSKNNIMKFGLLGCYIIFLSALTYQRNILWNDPISMWSDVIEKSPNKVRPRFFRGYVYLQNKEYKSAILDLKTVIAMDKNYYRAYDNLGVAYQDLKDYKSALIYYNEAIRLKPTSSYAYNNRASVYIILGRYEEALKDLNTAVSITGNYTDAYYNLGYVYFMLKKYDIAIKHFEYALNLNPAYIDIYNYLSYSYNELGNFQKAKELVDLMRTKGITPNPRLLERLKM